MENQEIRELEKAVRIASTVSELTTHEGYKIIKSYCDDIIYELTETAGGSDDPNVNLSCNKQILGIKFVLELADELIKAGTEASLELEKVGR